MLMLSLKIQNTYIKTAVKCKLVTYIHIIIFCSTEDVFIHFLIFILKKSLLFFLSYMGLIISVIIYFQIIAYRIFCIHKLFFFQNNKFFFFYKLILVLRLRFLKLGTLRIANLYIEFLNNG